MTDTKKGDINAVLDEVLVQLEAIKKVVSLTNCQNQQLFEICAKNLGYHEKILIKNLQSNLLRYMKNYEETYQEALKEARKEAK